MVYLDINIGMLYLEINRDFSVWYTQSYQNPATKHTANAYPNIRTKKAVYSKSAGLILTGTH